ncbi:hypothetical protein HHI36_017708 [Cryptolaemus montrouzieri]|uniref:Uncharacterized protein n=1 Tax=Cryptolaemus montrouzieri TaxID=559131 RepID=A0ABD2NNP7_9CUCU
MGEQTPGGSTPGVFEYFSPRAIRIISDIELTNKNNLIDLMHVNNEIDFIKKSKNLSSASIEQIEILTQKLNEAKKIVNKDKEFKFKDNDRGPFVVTIESIDNNIGNLNPASVGRMLYINSNCNQLDIINIYRLGLKKIGVQFKYPKNANDFLLNNTLDKSNFNVFIAPRLVTSMGIVRDVGIDIPDHEIVEKGKGLYPDAKVLRVRRFNRRVKNDNNEIITTPSYTCLITFEDSKLNNKNNDEDGFVSDTSARCEGGETTPYNKFDKDVKNSGDIFKRKLVSYKKLNMDVVTS